MTPGMKGTGTHKGLSFLGLLIPLPSCLLHAPLTADWLLLFLIPAAKTSCPPPELRNIYDSATHATGLPFSIPVSNARDKESGPE